MDNRAQNLSLQNKPHSYLPGLSLSLPQKWESEVQLNEVDRAYLNRSKYLQSSSLPLPISLSDSQCHYLSLFKALFIDLSCCYKSFLCSLSLSVISFSLSLLYLTNNCWSNFLSLSYSLCSWFLVSLSLFSSREYLLVSLVGWLSNETRFERLWYLSTKSLPHTSLKTVRIVAQ